MIEALDTALAFPYPQIIASGDRTRCNYRPINFRETAPRRVLTVGNINSDATGFDITCGKRSQYPHKKWCVNQV
ncbi:hypothetical protein [Microcoleus sp. OTE_8_concoct_300]|uniref:hypothetical protein n=1 Tax=Microcoleus sp. OTE_8_concoct_300 TaxID=2964710 RepID=UPI00403F4646